MKRTSLTLSILLLFAGSSGNAQEEQGKDYEQG